MEIRMKYGHREFVAGLDDKNILEVIEGTRDNCTKTEDEILDEALAHPIDSARLSQLVHAGETVCIVIPDITRAWQHTERYLYKIVDELNAGGVKDEDIVFLSATGTHRRQTPEEHERLLGPNLVSRFKIIDHDCLDKESNVYLGTTSFGNRVSLDRRALECDHVVLTGAIVYHFLAGWSGGKKAVLPGIAAYETIMSNHALSLKPEFGAGIVESVRSANIEENPVHQDMMEAASFIKPLFLFNVVMGHDGKVAGAVAGNYITAHAKGRKIVDRTDSVKIKGLSDVVIATSGGYPKDINLYQSIKLLINAREAVRENGTIIMVTECSEGIGGDEGINTILTRFKSLDERERYLRDAYTIAKFVGYYFCSTAVEYNLIMVTSIDPGLLASTGIKIVKTLDEAIALAFEKHGPDCTINVMPHGANTFPVLEK
jgi:nickel-dependent lactate racemase